MRGGPGIKRKPYSLRRHNQPLYRCRKCSALVWGEERPIHRCLLSEHVALAHPRETLADAGAR